MPFICPWGLGSGGLRQIGLMMLLGLDKPGIEKSGGSGPYPFGARGMSAATSRAQRPEGRGFARH